MAHATLEHRHGHRVHEHPNDGAHRHLLAPRRSEPVAHEHHALDDHEHEHEHGHTHGLVDDSIKRSREGVRAVFVSLLVLGVAAVAQTVVFMASGSVALLADLIHNFGDALTAVPLADRVHDAIAPSRARAGLAVVAAIFVSACVAAAEAVERLMHRTPPTHLGALAIAGAIGFTANFVAAPCERGRDGTSAAPALVADGQHARADAYVSLAVVASAAVVTVGVPVADPLIGLAITIVILRITWQSWRTVRAAIGHPPVAMASWGCPRCR